MSSTPPPLDLLIPTEPSGIRSPILPEPSITPPTYDVYPLSDQTIRNSPPLNPWNPYLRSYGRVYPYGLGVRQYENGPRNWMVSMRDEPVRPILPNYQPVNMQSIDYTLPRSSSPNVTEMRSALNRPRSNRSFLHYRNDGRDLAEPEANLDYSTLPVIEISSEEDEDEARSLPIELTRRFDGNNVRSPFNRSHANKENVLNRSRFENAFTCGLRRTPAESKPIIHAHNRRSSSEESISSTANHQHYHHHMDDVLNLSNRMKRPHRHSPHVPNKHCRLNGECRHSRRSPETNELHNAVEPNETSNRRPNVDEIDNNVNSTSASTSQSIDNTDNNMERKFKIRIKREFKTEFKPEIKTEFKTEFKTELSNDNVGADSEIAPDTKEHLKTLITNIKQE